MPYLDPIKAAEAKKRSRIKCGRNKEYDKEYRKKWYKKQKEERPEEHASQMREWRNSNKEKFRERYKKWRDGKPENYKINCIRARAKRNNLEFNLDAKWFKEQYDLGCSVSKQPFQEYFDGVTFFHKASVDRIDNSKGYIKDNCRLIKYGINAFKQDLSEEEFKNQIKILYEALFKL